MFKNVIHLTLTDKAACPLLRYTRRGHQVRLILLFQYNKSANFLRLLSLLGFGEFHFIYFTNAIAGK